MAGTKRSSWEWLVTGSKRSAREERPLEYAVRCMRDGACLEEVVDDPYVRGNFSQHDTEQVMADPQLVHAAREWLEAGFESGVGSREGPVMARPLPRVPVAKEAYPQAGILVTCQ